MCPIKVIFVPYYGTPYEKLLRENLQKFGIEVKYAYEISIFNWFSFYALLGSTYKYWKPSLIHMHWQHPLLLESSRLKTIVKSSAFIIALRVLKVLGIKLVWTVHNLKDHENRQQKLELFFTRLLAHLCDGIIVHCKYAKYEVQKIFCVKSEDKIAVIPHGSFIGYYENTISRSEARAKLGLSPSDIIFLFIGLIRPYKGVPELIDAFKKLNVNRAKLIIIGKIVDEQIAEQIKRKTSSNGNIQIIPKFIPDDEIQIYMNAANAVVCPYRDILTSAGIISAMSFGKAIIVPAIGCVPETLADSQNFIYDPNMRDGLMEAMKTALNSEADLQKIGESNLEIAKKLDWKEIGRSTYEVYKRCLNN